MNVFFIGAWLAACGGSVPDLFSSPAENPEAVEALLREVAPAIGALESQVLHRQFLVEKDRLLFAAALPELAKSKAHLKRFSFHIERAVGTENRLDVLLSHEALTDGKAADGWTGLSHLKFEKAAESWGLVDWLPRAEQGQSHPQFVFQEVLGERTNPEFAAVLQQSIHEEKVRERLLTGVSKGATHPLEMAAFDRHPGVAIGDVDGNGWEDILILSRWGPNTLMLNDKGQFQSGAAAWGLADFPHSTSAVFADLDNDGDLDLILGRSLVPSLILINNGRSFVPKDTPAPLPQLVSSVSVVDVNSDGLLDVYFATYAASLVERIRDFSGLNAAQARVPLQGFLPEKAAQVLAEQIVSAQFQFYLERPGPPNRLFENRGGGEFTDRTQESGLGLFLNTYQAAWSDVDLDGDPDLYLANDFAPNHLFINQGNWQFSDQTESFGVADFGFGMGVSWGDFDGDGRFDLYVSNMYSRAGRRITGGQSGMDPRVQKAARGNSLFRNTGSGFERVSGLDSGLQVERAGWAWGGQFIDVNNDGLQDIYVPNGYYSAPKEAALDRDT